MIRALVWIVETLIAAVVVAILWPFRPLLHAPSEMVVDEELDSDDPGMDVDEP